MRTVSLFIYLFMHLVICLVLVQLVNMLATVIVNAKIKKYKISSKKWWTRPPFDIIDRAIYNSFVLHNESANHPRQSLKNLRLKLAKDLIGWFSSCQKRGQESLEQPQHRLVKRHFPEYLPCNEKGKRTERRCTVCTANKTKKKTSCYCPQCNVGLCPAPCFPFYHQAD